MKSHQPAYYASPLKSRKDIIAFLVNESNRRYYDRAYAFCFNVKCYRTDFSYENLLVKAREYEQLNKNQAKRFKIVLEGMDQNELWSQAIDDARMAFDKGNDETHFGLWDGTTVPVEYEFVGRSGGWLAISKFAGYKLEDIEELDEMDYKTLRLLYRHVIHLKHDLKPVDSQVEFCAAWVVYSQCGFN